LPDNDLALDTSNAFRLRRLVVVKTRKHRSSRPHGAVRSPRFPSLVSGDHFFLLETSLKQFRQRNLPV
jgi:hypothetical protein